jgi:hypothetical protein
MRTLSITKEDSQTNKNLSLKKIHKTKKSKQKQKKSINMDYNNRGGRGYTRGGCGGGRGFGRGRGSYTVDELVTFPRVKRENYNSRLTNIKEETL